MLFLVYSNIIRKFEVLVWIVQILPVYYQFLLTFIIKYRFSPQNGKLYKCLLALLIKFQEILVMIAIKSTYTLRMGKNFCSERYLFDTGGWVYGRSTAFRRVDICGPHTHSRQS